MHIRKRKQKQMVQAGRQKDIPITRALEVVSLNKLKLDPSNPRINDESAKKLAALIQEYGFITPLTIDPNNVIRKGNTGYKAAQILGLREVPCVRINFHEAKALTYAMADNKSSEWSDWDEDLLRDIMARNDVQEYTQTRERLAALTGFKETELAGLHFEADVGAVDGVTGENTTLASVVRIECLAEEKDELIDMLTEWSSGSGFTGLVIR